MKKSDVYTGASLVAFCAYGWYETSKWTDVVNTGLSVKLYPRIVFLILGILGFILLIRGLKSKENDKISFSFKTLLPVVVLLIAYTLLLEYLGFVITTFLFLGIAMYLFGEKNIKKILLIDVIGTGVLYLIFVKLLMIQL